MAVGIQRQKLLLRTLATSTRINGPLYPTPPSQGFYPLPYPAPERNVPRWNYTKADLEKSEKSGPGFEKYVDLGINALKVVEMFGGDGSW